MKLAETLYTTKEFAKDADEAFKTASTVPVAISSEQGDSLFVLMNLEHYMKLRGNPQSIADALYMPGADSADLESFLPARGLSFRVPDLDQMFLLDTNSVSEMRKMETGAADPYVAAWTRSQIMSTLYISAVSLMEIEIGILGLERRDALQGAVLRKWLSNAVIPGFSGRVLTIDAKVCLRCAGLHVPNRRNFVDSLIAATALVHGMTVVTRNMKDFEGTGAAVLNPWVR